MRAEDAEAEAYERALPRLPPCGAIDVLRMEGGWAQHSAAVELSPPVDIVESLPEPVDPPVSIFEGPLPIVVDAGADESYVPSPASPTAGPRSDEDVAITRSSYPRPEIPSPPSSSYRCPQSPGLYAAMFRSCRPQPRAASHPTPRFRLTLRRPRQWH
jgi:hypothetical protein